MTNARWRRIQDLYHAARERLPDVRSEYLREACDGDSALLDEVQSLLAQPISAEHFLASGGVEGSADTSSVRVGYRLGVYEFQAFIGRGGMGEVYRARDTKLGRDVAIKILPRMFTLDSARLARFEREARVLASLNHPHIGAIYGLEEGDGIRALVLELIQGETLADRLERGPIAVIEALQIARQIVEALEAAHATGVVHRDLKPANVKITPDGIVKVLDFGLAKFDLSASSSRLTAAGTMRETRDGMILGTEAYMSPEQARGIAVDKRSDIWAFGCVLYEMLTGRTAFGGDTLSDTLVAILEREPDWTALPATTPPPVTRLLRRCFQKNRKDRAPDIGLARLEIEEALAAPSFVNMSQPGAPRIEWSRAFVWTIAAVFCVALVAVLFVWALWKSTAAPDPMVALRLSVAPPYSNHFDVPSLPAVSPDGQYIVFAATSNNDEKHQLWLRPLDSMTAVPLTGTENAIYPFWSPDSKSIGFFAAGKLKKMNVSGGPATPLADASQGRGGTWSRDGIIVFAPTIYNGLFQVPASGGDVRRATRFDPGTPPQKFPWFLPDGKHFLFLFGAGGRDQQTIRIGSVDSPNEDRVLLTGADSAAMYAQEHVLFARDTTLVARRFDAARLAFTGEEVPVADHLLTKDVPAQSWVFSVSANGVLVYESAAPNTTQLTWLDRTGKRMATVGDPGDLRVVEFSPDHRTAAVTVGDASNFNVGIWLYDILRGLPTRFAYGPAPHNNPVWSPDGRVLVFNSNRTGRYDIYRKVADGSGNEEMLYADNLLKTPTSFSPDGSHLAYWAYGDPRTGDDIWILPGPLTASPSSKPYPFLQTEFNEHMPQFSPDGHWIAYRSNESGRYEVYAAPFPASGRKRQVSTTGGSLPRWRADGKELFYVGADNRLMAAAVKTNGGSFEVKKVEPLFGPVPGSYDVSADGLRFITVSPVAGETYPPMTVVQNWVATIKSGK